MSRNRPSGITEHPMFDAKALRVTSPIPIFCSNGSNRCDARLFGWRYLFTQDGRVVRVGDISIEGKKLTFRGFTDGHFLGIENALLAAERMADITRRHFQLRIVALDKLHAEVVWMKPKSGTAIYIPIGPSPGPLPANVPFTKRQFERAVRLLLRQSHAGYRYDATTTFLPES